MEAFFDYLLKSSIWITAFAAIYFLFLRNERYFFLNRIFLITGLLAGLFFPFITFTYEVETVPAMGAITIGDLLAEVIPIDVVKSEFSVPFILSILFVAGMVLMFSHLTYQTVKVIRIIRRSEVERLYSAKVIKNDIFLTSFTFFSYVFVNPSVRDAEIKEIIAHEKGHIGQYHWIDIVLCETLRIIQWFNPFVWFYGRFIRQNHEYLADKAALKQTENSSVYKAVLLNQLMGDEVIKLAHLFNYSLNKKRFNMMKNSYIPFINRFKVLMIIPVAGFIFYTCGTNKVAKESKKEKIHEMVDVLPEYPGGFEALMAYLNSETRYPKIAHENGIQGRVYVRFVVDSKGNITNVEVTKGVDASLDIEALRVINAMPQWKPGEHKRKKVSVYFTLPINFVLQ